LEACFEAELIGEGFIGSCGVLDSFLLVKAQLLGIHKWLFDRDLIVGGQWHSAALVLVWLVGYLDSSWGVCLVDVMVDLHLL
jgi:hypothetical protein